MNGYGMTVLGIGGPEEGPRRRVDDQPTTGLPDWLAAIVKLGVPSAIGIYLVWVITSSLTASVAQTRDMMMQHELAASNSRLLLQHHIEETTEIRMLLSKICENTAKNDMQRDSCGRYR